MSIYHEIHRLHRLGFNKSQIERKVGVNRDTVRKYLTKDFEEMSEWTYALQNRTKKLDPYADIILEWLKEHSDLSAAQVEDWLLEEYPNVQVSSSTVRSYVKNIREQYAIPKRKNIRQYEAVPEVEMAAQIQVDWGQTKQTTRSNDEIKLYFISFVLSHSRYKYLEWLDRPFTTADTIRSHENAFRHFGGMPEEMVYDQDNLIAVSENAGDLLLTQDFQAYQQALGFGVYLCRGEDPETKGKIERVVGYVKANFAKNRIYDGLDDWNEKSRAWLARTGNHKVHGTTKKRPDSVFLLEKAHLKPVSSIKHKDISFKNSITATVNKDNTIRFRGNRYSVPLGTYKTVGSNQVSLFEQDQELVILHKVTDEEIARHTLSLEKGKLIKNRNHGRDREKTLQKYRTAMIGLFDQKEAAILFIDKVVGKYRRYARDQFMVLEKSVQKFPEQREATLEYCIENELWSANDFRDVASYLNQHSPEAIPQGIEETVSTSSSGIQVSTRSISEYVKIMGGEMNE